MLPFLGFLINGFFGARLSKRIIGVVACSTIGASFLLAVSILAQMLGKPAGNRIFEPVFYTWIQSGYMSWSPAAKFSVDAAFLIDPLSMVMLLVVTGVGFLIHVYSIGYMHDDPGFSRFFAYLNLFASAMLVLVMANNFLLMFVGWEGVGLCSYLLIGFFYEKQSAADAGKKAFVVNRIGDFGFLLAIFLIFWTFGTLNFQDVFKMAESRFLPGDAIVVAVTLLLFLGATGKSAQIPLYVWLPDAMEGPTPVSALIHAATMVTAGVYMVARCSILYALSPFTLGVVAVIGCATALFAATIGLVQNDIKRVLAYSTVSQLGYMFLACGVGAFTAGVFHLMTHAFFKALLFLGSGSVIHALGGEQDIRKMGGLRKDLPVTYTIFVVGALAIAGIFPFAGFFSKDEILWDAWVSGNKILYALGLLGALLTAFYMFRLIFLTFHGTSRMEHGAHHHVHEAPPTMRIPLIILAVLSLVGGWVQIPFIEHGKRFGDFLAPVFSPAHAILAQHHAAHPAHWVEGALMGLSLIIAITGISFAFLFYLKDTKRPALLAERHAGIYRTLYNKYYIDELYQAVVIRPLQSSSEWVLAHFDLGVIDTVVNAVGRFFTGIADKARRIQTGYVHHYALSVLVGACALFVYTVLR